jgi:hypothetical protein
VESIPDALWGPNGRRRVYDQHILTLANDPEVRLVTRIEDLLRSCDSGLLTAEIKERRQITCLKALWAIASLADPTERTQFLFDLSAVYSLATSVPFTPEVSDAVHQHAVSVYILIQWHLSCALNSVLREEDFQLDHIPDTTLQMLVFRNKLQETLGLPWDWGINSSPLTGLWATMEQSLMTPVCTWAQDNLQELQLAASKLPCCILMDYFHWLLSLKQLPYNFLDTHTAILGNLKPPNSEHVLDSLEEKLSYAHNYMEPYPGDEHGWCPIDEVFRVAGSIWKPDASNLRPAPSAGMIDYLIWRQGNNEILRHMLKAWDPLLLFKGLTIDLEHISNFERPLDALWILCSSDSLIRWRPSLQRQVYEGVISAINEHIPATVTPRLSITEPLLVLAKYHWLNSPVTQSQAIAMLQHPIMPTETAVELPAMISSALLQDKILDPGIFGDIFQIRCVEAKLCLLIDLLDICCVATLPARAAETVKYLQIYPRLGGPVGIHEAHQLRLANSIRNIAKRAKEPVTGGDHQQLLHAVVKLQIWDPHGDSNQWLNHPVARETLKDCFAECARTLVALDSPEQDFIRRLNDVVKGLESTTPSENYRRKTLEAETRRQKLVELLEKEIQPEASLEAKLEHEEDLR